MLERRNVLIGMVHIGALPGTPRATDPPATLIEQAVRESLILREAGFDAVLVENMHDLPYVHGPLLGPEQPAVMAVAAARIADASGLPLGVQILSGGNSDAMAVSLASGGAFIRCENYVYAHVADEGLLAQAEAGPLLRYRRSIGAEHIGVFCDIKKKHASHAVTADLSIEDVAEAAVFFGADALIVTGVATGKPASVDDVSRVAAVAGAPVLVGSGVDAASLPGMLEHASAVIVGSSIKHGGVWNEPVDPARAAALVQARDRI